MLIAEIWYNPHIYICQFVIDFKNLVDVMMIAELAVVYRCKIDIIYTTNFM